MFAITHAPSRISRPPTAAPTLATTGQSRSIAPSISPRKISVSSGAARVNTSRDAL
jgi:hypothetical protein